MWRVVLLYIFTRPLRFGLPCTGVPNTARSVRMYSHTTEHALKVSKKIRVIVESWFELYCKCLIIFQCHTISARPTTSFINSVPKMQPSPPCSTLPPHPTQWICTPTALLSQAIPIPPYSNTPYPLYHTLLQSPITSLPYPSYCTPHPSATPYCTPHPCIHVIAPCTVSHIPSCMSTPYSYSKTN